MELLPENLSTLGVSHVANQYYAGGRTLSMQMLRDAYEHVMRDGKQMQTRYLPQMEETARGLNTARIMEMVPGAVSYLFGQVGIG